jgi:beta-aspartyl-peptidase (threonine type)
MIKLLRRATALMVLLLGGLLLSVGASGAHSGTLSAADQGVKALLQRQVDAWNRGDLDAFMSGYLRSPDTSYTSAGTAVWGYDALRERYQKKYGASPETMGKLHFSDLKVFDLGKRNALCIGQWHLERSEKPAIDGIFSLVLVRTGDGWKIIHDHTSTSDEKK